MQSENGILLLFYIFLSHGNEKKKKKKKKNGKRGVGCKKGGMLCPVHKYLCVEQLFVIFSDEICYELTNFIK